MTKVWKPGDFIGHDDLNRFERNGGGVINDPRAFGAMGDGVTLDTAGVQAALNAAAGGGRAVIPAGLTFLVGPLALPNGIVVQLDGTLKLKPNGGACVVGSLNAPQNVMIEGSGTLDGNAAQQNQFSQGFIADQANNVQIRGITITNTRNAGWSFTRSTNCLVEGVVVNGQGNTSGFAFASSDCWAIGCTIKGVTTDYGFEFYGNVHRSGIVGCDISGCLAPGICVFADQYQGGACSDIVIADNIIHDNPGGAIGIQYIPTPPATSVPAGTHHKNIIVTGNRCFNNCVGNNGQGPGVTGVYLTSGVNVLIANNQFGPDGNAATATCIAVVGGTHSINTVVEGNFISDQGTAAGNNSLGIFADGGDSNTTIRGNVVCDTRTPSTMGSAIFMPVAGAGCVVEGNTAHGFAAPYTIDPALNAVRNEGVRWSFDTAVFACAGITVTGGSVSVTTPGAGVEIGSTATPGASYVDFHSSGAAQDYDARIQASGGSATASGAGSLAYQAAQHNFSGAVAMSGAVTLTGTAAMTGPVLHTGLPTSAAGLPAGSVWKDTANGNVLKVV